MNRTRMRGLMFTIPHFAATLCRRRNPARILKTHSPRIALEDDFQLSFVQRDHRNLRGIDRDYFKLQYVFFRSQPTFIIGAGLSADSRFSKRLKARPLTSSLCTSRSMAAVIAGCCPR